MPHYTYRAEFIRCGKSCKGCPHGPYWYAYYREDGRLHKRYHGKIDPRSSTHNNEPVFDPRELTETAARAILGLSATDGFTSARSAYRTLSKLHHPDRGGDNETAVKINAAWSYLRAYHGWK